MENFGDFARARGIPGPRRVKFAAQERAPKVLAANFRFQSCIAPGVLWGRAIASGHSRQTSARSEPVFGGPDYPQARLVSALGPLAPLGVVGFIFFRRQLLKISWPRLLAIFVENANVWRRLIYNGHSLESQRSAIVALHNLLSGLS